MATTAVYSGNYGSYLYIEYSFSANTSSRTWSLSTSLKLYIPRNVSFGEWYNTSVHSADLVGGYLPYTTGETNVLLDTYNTSGNYNSNGDAPSVNVSWAWNVNSSWGGYVNPYGDKTLTGSSIGPDGTPPTGLTATLVEAGPDWADISMSISSWGSPSTSANRYIEAAVLGSSSYGAPYRYKRKTAAMSETFHIDNSADGGLTITPNTQYRVGGRANNQTRNASTVGSTFTTLPATPVVSATDQGHGVIDFAVTHSNEGSALTVTDEYSIDGGTTWTAISGGAFTLTLATQTEVIVKRSSTAGDSIATITVIPQFDVGIYASANEETVKVTKVYAPGPGRYFDTITQTSTDQVVSIVNQSALVSALNANTDVMKYLNEDQVEFEGIQVYQSGVGNVTSYLIAYWNGTGASQRTVELARDNDETSFIYKCLNQFGVSVNGWGGGRRGVTMSSTYSKTNNDYSVGTKVAKIYASVNGKTKLVFEDPS